MGVGAAAEEYHFERVPARSNDRVQAMNSKRVQELLSQLRAELDATDVDPETLALVRELDADIQARLGSTDNPVDALVKRAKAVEVKFAVTHRVAERILREIVETLARMGV